MPRVQARLAEQSGTEVNAAFGKRTTRLVVPQVRSLDLSRAPERKPRAARTTSPEVTDD